MSQPYDAASPYPPPPPHAPPPPRLRRSFLGILLGLSALFNIVFFFLFALSFLAVIILGSANDESEHRIRESFHSGKSGASDKVAVVRVEGVIMEGMIDFAQRQVEQAAKDDHVKAIVLRINSPGGSITASDELHRRIRDLCLGTAEHQGKPAVVSMGALAASGGYYIAMPVKTLYAERTTLTGSIGVFASFPNVKELGEKVGVKMETIKKGTVKDAGSPFKEMTPQERQLWQDMVDHAYEQFLQVVRDGRPDLKGILSDVVVRRTITVHDAETNQDRQEEYVRTRVDGGIFTADQAKEFGLIDQVGFLEDAIKDVAKKAGLGEDYQAIKYERQRSVAERLLGVEMSQFGSKPQLGASLIDPARLASAATPRLWYLSSQAELAGLFTSVGR